MFSTIIRHIRSLIQIRRFNVPDGCATFASKGRVPKRSTGLVEQPIQLLCGMTEESIHPIKLLLAAISESDATFIPLL